MSWFAVASVCPVSSFGDLESAAGCESLKGAGHSEGDAQPELSKSSSHVFYVCLVSRINCVGLSLCTLAPHIGQLASGGLRTGVRPMMGVRAHRLRLGACVSVCSPPFSWHVGGRSQLGLDLNIDSP